MTTTPLNGWIPLSTSTPERNFFMVIISSYYTELRGLIRVQIVVSNTLYMLPLRQKKRYMIENRQMDFL